jgi:biopolymer transport protein ExbD
MDEKPFESMNVIPFVDIMLVLLTIVLTTSSFIASGRIPVNLPQASKSAAENRKVQIIELGPGGDIFYNGKTATPASLKSTLGPLSRDLLKQMNFTKVAVQTENRT